VGERFLFGFKVSSIHLLEEKGTQTRGKKKKSTNPIVSGEENGDWNISPKRIIIKIDMVVKGVEISLTSRGALFAKKRGKGKAVLLLIGEKHHLKKVQVSPMRTWGKGPPCRRCAQGKHKSRSNDLAGSKFIQQWKSHRVRFTPVQGRVGHLKGGLTQCVGIVLARKEKALMRKKKGI